MPTAKSCKSGFQILLSGSASNPTKLWTSIEAMLEVNPRLSTAGLRRRTRIILVCSCKPLFFGLACALIKEEVVQSILRFLRRVKGRCYSFDTPSGIIHSRTEPTVQTGVWSGLYLLRDKNCSDLSLVK